MRGTVCVLLALLCIASTVFANLGCNTDNDCGEGQKCHATTLSSGAQFTYCIVKEKGALVANYMAEKSQNILENKTPAAYTATEEEANIESADTYASVDSMPAVGSDVRSGDQYTASQVRTGSDSSDSASYKPSVTSTKVKSTSTFAKVAESYDDSEDALEEDEYEDYDEEEAEAEMELDNVEEDLEDELDDDEDELDDDEEY